MSASCGEGPEPERVRAEFERIAPAYDLINTLISGGLHHRWRRWLLRQAAPPPGARVLDLCGGTGALTRLWLRRYPDTRQVVLADFSPAMLRLAQRRLSGTRVRVVAADALRLPFPEATFDVVLCGYGLRNLAGWRPGLAEMARVLRPGGEVLLLDMFREPWPWPVRFYVRALLPWIGGLLSGSRSAYAWLPESLDCFASAAQVVAEMGRAGFQGIRRWDMLWRASTALVGRRG